MPMVKMSVAAINGVIQGAYGTYVAGADGIINADVRDAAAILAAGGSYVRNGTNGYTLPIAPRNASAGRIVASTALSSGAVSLANQPDVARQINIILGGGSPVVTSGLVSVTYKAADGNTYTETFDASTLTPLNGNFTGNLSRPAVHINTITVGAVAGGSNPFIRMDDTNFLGLPADVGAVDFAMVAEFDSGTNQASPGTPSVSCTGATSVVNAPDGSKTFAFIYNFLAPIA